MGFFDKELYASRLSAYYAAHYGEQDADHWYEQPAVNVWVFRRGDAIITLKSDVLTGEVTQRQEQIATP